MPSPRTPQSASTTVHPLYAQWLPSWLKLAHCYEGSGGFLDGTYLIAHPREWEDYKSTTPKKPTKKLKARRAIARYENVAATILDQVKSALFRGSVSRTIGESEDTTKEHPLHAWWQNVDGRRTPIDDYMALTWTPCGIYGHLAHLMELPSERSGDTAADAGQPFLCAYTAVDLADWLVDEYGAVTAVKLLEIEPRTDIKAPAPTEKTRVRLVDEVNWELLDSQGVRVDGAAHGFGRVPVVVQFAKRRALSTVVGQSVLSDPQLYIDLYNLTSELRELLRNQTFSMLNVVLGTGLDAMTVEKAMELLNATGGSGTENIIFSAAASDYVAADSTNVTVYQSEREQLLRTIYRLSGVPWEADSKDAEATGSLKLKREDMNQVLATYADECEKAEYQFVELWFRHTYPNRWEKELEDAQVTIRYPDTFDVTPFAEILEQAQAALSLDMPPRFLQELKQRLVAKFLPDATQDVVDEIEAELKKQAAQAPKDQQAEFKAKLQKLAGGGQGGFGQEAA